MKIRLIAVLLAAALAAIGFAGCGGQAASSSSSAMSSSSATSSSGSQATQSADTVTFTDDLGKEVTVAKAPKRVVSCMGSFADIWQLAGGTLVGAADEAFEDYGIDAGSVARIGGFSNPDLEAIIALNPDFVICTGATAGRGGTDQTKLADGLAASGIPVAYFTVTTFDDYLRMLKTCTEITGDSSAYERYGTSQRAAIDAAIAKYSPGAAGKSVALLISYSGGARVQNAHTQTGAMLADLGYANVADKNPSLLSDFSVEALLEINPDYVLVVPMGNTSDEAANAMAALTGNSAWSSLSAVAGGRFFQLDPELYVNKPDARWAEAYDKLGALLAG
ncbi:MAG: ABC transporter substrate-binding protein [Eggerthellaceae bacterium]|nr:ABC transporter substrate-binding protein [Eggerthellaceae bacterium]